MSAQISVASLLLIQIKVVAISSKHEDYLNYPVTKK